jgi:prolyl oligopeptidase PreP (S9A serine peptidase family)
VLTREQIRDRLSARWNYPRSGVPFERGRRWFQTRNQGLQAQSVLYVMDAPQDEGRVLIDPNAVSSEGTIALGAVSVSPVGSKVAYATSTCGSDWLTWRVRDVASGADQADLLEWSKSEDAEWAKDGSGFYYAAAAAYPPTLLTAGDHDDRVVPSHSFKFAAALAAAQQGGAPILLRVETSAGHSAARKPAAKAIAEAADRLAFLDGALGTVPA